MMSDQEEKQDVDDEFDDCKVTFSLMEIEQGG